MYLCKGYLLGPTPPLGQHGAICARPYPGPQLHVPRNFLNFGPPLSRTHLDPSPMRDMVQPPVVGTTDEKAFIINQCHRAHPYTPDAAYRNGHYLNLSLHGSNCIVGGQPGLAGHPLSTSLKTPGAPPELASHPSPPNLIVIIHPRCVVIIWNCVMAKTTTLLRAALPGPSRVPGGHPKRS